jgi:hypothetical protein
MKFLTRKNIHYKHSLPVPNVKDASYGEKNRGKIYFAHVHLEGRDINPARKVFETMFSTEFLFEEKVRNARIAIMEKGGTFLHISGTKPGEMIPSRAPRGCFLGRSRRHSRGRQSHLYEDPCR